jgi:hypothetical protein
MKNTNSLSLLLRSILCGLTLLASSVLAQTTNSSSTNSPSEPDPVALARSAYLQPENASSPVNQSAAGNPAAGENVTLAQFAPPRFGPPYRPMRRPMGGYPGMWTGPHFEHHAAMGALIGFGVGATAGALIGASNNNGANRGADAFVGGLLLGGLGAAFGAAIASFPGFPSHRYRPWEDEGHDELGSRSKRHSTSREASSHRAKSGALASQGSQS